VAAAGWFANHYLSIRREADSKRKRFRVFVEMLQRKITPIAPSDMYLHHTPESHDFDSEISNVMASIPAKHMARCDTACNEYRTIRFYGSTATVENTEKKNRLVSLLKELLDYAR